MLWSPGQPLEEKQHRGIILRPVSNDWFPSCKICGIAVFNVVGLVVTRTVCGCFDSYDLVAIKPHVFVIGSGFSGISSSKP